MNTFGKIVFVGLAAAVGAATLPAFAHDAACHERRGHGDQSSDHDRSSGRVEKLKAELHDKLKLTAGQEAAWTAFAAKMRPAEPPHRPDWSELSRLPAPQRMEKMLSLMQEREARLAERVVTVKDYYATLTPEQQKTFDGGFTWPHGRPLYPR